MDMCYTINHPYACAHGMAMAERVSAFHHMAGGHTVESGMAETPTDTPSKKRRTPVGEVNTTGTVVGPLARKTSPVVDQTKWRRKLQEARIKFDDIAKETFLNAFAETGLKKRSADAAGVCLLTVIRHQKNDPDFAEAYDEAVAAYRDKFVGKAINELAFKGIKRERLKDNEVVETWREYPIPLILAELKRIDQGFRDKQDVNIGIGGGVLVVSGPMTPEEWVADQEKKNKERNNPMLDDPFTAARMLKAPPQGDIIDVEAVEVILPDRTKDVAERAARRAEEVAALVAKAAGMKVIK